MIYAYGITEQGTYHIKHDIVCQDAHKIIKCLDDLVIAAVADGLGSEEHSDIASKIAVGISTDYCANHIERITGRDNILDIIKSSFSSAQDTIEQEAHKNGHAIDQYDTTLTLAIMLNDTLYYGHSGDSGIIALTTEGLYKKVTEQQRDEDNRVFPLFFKDKWVFGQFDEKVCSVFLATDGMFETLFPIYIKNEPINIHITLARFFMDNRTLQIDKFGEDEITKQMKGFIGNIQDTQVNDDKTVVVLINTSIESTLQPDEYYNEPDWDELKCKRNEEWKRLAYPHLFKDAVTETTDASLLPANNSVDNAGNENIINDKCNEKRVFGIKNFFKRIFKK